MLVTSVCDADVERVYSAFSALVTRFIPVTVGKGLRFQKKNNMKMSVTCLGKNPVYD